MDTMAAFMRGLASRDRELMVFDWEKAANIIAKRKPKAASAGLRGDWGHTGGVIFDGAPVPRGRTYTFLASTWATPELDVDGEVIPCFRMKSEVPNWDSDTYWPEDALNILNSQA